MGRTFSLIDRQDPRTLARLMTKVPRAVIDWRRARAFVETVRFAAEHSPFYRRRFKERGIDPRAVASAEDLGDFYTTPEDIVEHAEEFVCRDAHLVFESSGTTGRNKRVYLSNDEMDHTGRMMAAGLFLGGVTASDRLVNALDFSIWIPGMITQKCLEHSGLFGMAAGKIDPAEVYRRMGTYRLNVVMGEPTWLIRLTELAERNGAYPVKYLIGGAEALPDAARSWMEKVWTGAKVRMVYASVESAGIIGFESFSECADYHINENDFFVEIADAAADGYGEVVFTTLARRTMPLIRYRARDISSIEPAPCACGLPFRKLRRIRGRVDEMVVSAGGNLYPLLFEKVLEKVSGITRDWQVVFGLRGIKEVCEINLEASGTPDRPRIEREVLAGFRELYPDFWKNYGLGIFEIAFAYHAPGEIRKDRKLIRLVDKRHAQ